MRVFSLQNSHEMIIVIIMFALITTNNDLIEMSHSSGPHIQRSLQAIECQKQNDIDIDNVINFSSNIVSFIYSLTLSLSLMPSSHNSLNRIAVDLIQFGRGIYKCAEIWSIQTLFEIEITLSLLPKNAISIVIVSDDKRKRWRTMIFAQSFRAIKFLNGFACATEKNGLAEQQQRREF